MKALKKTCFPMMLGSQKSDGSKGGAAAPYWEAYYESGPELTKESRQGCVWASEEEEEESIESEEPKPDEPKPKVVDEQKVAEAGEDGEPGAPGKPRAEGEIERLPNTDGFCLDYFCEKTRGIKPEHNDGWWQRIASYAACMGYDPVVAGAKLQLLWRKKNPTEIEKLMQVTVENFDPERAPLRHAIVGWLDSHDIDWEPRNMWQPPKKYHWMHEYKRFIIRKGPKLMSEIKRFLHETVSYIRDQKLFVTPFKHTFRRKGKPGKKDEVENNYGYDMDGSAPFAGTDDFEILVQPDVREYIGAVSGLLATARQRKGDENKDALVASLSELVERLKRCKDFEEAATLCEGTLELDPKRTRISKIIKRMQLDHEIERYERVEYLPFNKELDGETGNVGEECFNIFHGFPLTDYKPTEAVDVRTTQLWQLFTEGWSNGEIDTFDWLCKALSYKLKYPYLKTKRSMYLRSLQQGNGKSTFFVFLSRLFGRKSVLFLLDLSRLFCKFNHWQAGALWIAVDDLTTATEKQIKKCKSRITANDFPFEPKNGKPLTLKVFEEFIFTSNEKDIFTESKDRRQLFFTMGNKFLQDKEFFDQIYSELDDQNVMYAWYRHLMDKIDLTGFCPMSQDCDPAACILEKNMQKLHCAKQSHRFLVDFFGEEDFATQFLKIHDDQRRWCSGYDIQKLDGPSPKEGGGHWPVGTLRFAVKSKQLFAAYKGWMRENAPSRKSNVRNIKTFQSEMEEIGVVYKSKVGMWSGEIANTAALIYHEAVRDQFVEVYGVFPEGLADWVIADGNNWKEAKKVIEGTSGVVPFEDRMVNGMRAFGFKK